jgi:hypothetical protein
MKTWRLYLDTSVFGGCFDEAERFATDSWRIMNAIQNGLVELFYSDSVLEELEDAPERVRDVFEAMTLNELKKLKPIPGFDCVEMKHRAQLRIYEETRGMSPHEIAEYFRSRAEARAALAKQPAPLSTMAKEVLSEQRP